MLPIPPEPDPPLNPVFDPHAEERARRKGVLLETWAELSAEADRVLLKLSVGGIGLLCGFIAPKGLAGIWEPVLFGSALACFVAATGLLLLLLHLNRQVLEQIYLKRDAQATEKKVAGAERRARILFAAGVLFAFALALMLGIRIGKGPEVPSDRVVGPDGVLQKSFTGASEMLRDPEPSRVEVVDSTPAVGRESAQAEPPAFPPPPADQD